MTFDIDGKITEDPGEIAITNGFESIDKRTGFPGGLSLATLSRNKGNSLSVSGHPAEGWVGLNLEVNGVIRTADTSSRIRQEKIIQIFQRYAKGDELWEKEFQWVVISNGKWFVKGLIFLIVFSLVVLFLVRGCVK